MLSALCACAHISNPKNTEADQKSECAALRSTLLKSSMVRNQNAASAVADTENMQLQEMYQHECE